MTGTASPADRQRYLKKALVAEEKTLAGLTQERERASAALEQGQKDLQQAREEVKAVQTLVQTLDRAFNSAMDVHSTQLGKVTRLKGELAQAESQMVGGVVPQR